MSQSTNKGLIFGIMIGTAGISLALVWYHKIRKSGAVIHVPKFWALSDAFHSAELRDELHGERGTVVALQGRQLQILEKLNCLVASMEELKEEVRFLKEAIPKLEELVRGELRGKAGVSRASPQHRGSRKRRSEPIPSHSSEEAESEGGCCFPDKTPIQDSSQDGISCGLCQDEVFSDSSQSSIGSQSQIEVRSELIHFSETGMRHATQNVIVPLSPNASSFHSPYTVSHLFLNLLSAHSLSAISHLSSSAVSRQSTSASGLDSQDGLIPQQANVNQAPQDGPTSEPLKDAITSEPLPDESKVTEGPLQDGATSASLSNPEPQGIFEVSRTSDSSLSRSPPASLALEEGQLISVCVSWVT
uniref:Regulator of microtubule dynamics 2 n=1 Tax=Ornithorhynchus anatinus TaxID=9258 RepID=A0A6I8NW45_ORNAN